VELSAGDALFLRSYLIEEGVSSRAVISALAAAAARGVTLLLGCDLTALSAFTRLCDGTTTLADELQGSSSRHPAAA
jgi:hypothetical protein